MRSDLVFGATTHVKNRYQLCQLAALATRKLHRPAVRVQDTTNDVLNRFSNSDPACTSTQSLLMQQDRAA
ncbi:MAG TPA: DNA-directed RNA polymerase subunit omega [Acidisarcina sp.]